jgi:hypothetical protein
MMNPTKASALRAAVGKVESSQKEVELILEEEARIKAAVETAVASGDETKIGDIVRDRTLLEMFPARITRKKAAQAEAISQLRQELESAVSAIVGLSSSRQQAAQKRILDFLSGELGEAYRAEELAREIAPLSRDYQAAEANLRDFSAVAMQSITTVQGLLDRVARIIGELEAQNAADPS